MKRVVLACALAAATAWAAIDVDALWNFDDPAVSEARFRAALIDASNDDALILRTQIARTFSLRQRFDDAHRELDTIEPALAAAGVEPRVRAWLERGRTLRSSGKPAEGKSRFVRAFEAADAARLERLAADALRDAAAAGQADPHVYNEIVLLHRAAGNEKLADDAEQRARQLRKQ